MSAGPVVFELPGGGRAAFTARAQGNMSSVGGDGAEHGGQSRARLRELLGLRALARGYQVHGDRVRVVREQPDEPDSSPRTRPAADGQATALPGVGPMVLAADCLPVALGCEGAVAVVHAGWRGLAAGVIEQGVLALRGLAGADVAIGAIVGPGAGPCCYEVGEEVHAAFSERTGAGASGPTEHTGAGAPIDLRAIAHERLRAAGVREVRDLQACTICDERFFSHRREGRRAGRQAGVAWLEGPHG